MEMKGFQMKSILGYAAIAALLLCVASRATAQDDQTDTQSAQSTAPVGDDYFQSSLSPYGDWVSVGVYGQVWRPAHVNRAWRPYMHGRWEWTDNGWYWASAEPFGWATYHYGRWEYDDYYGWVWVPGSTWGPAWVEWRYSDDYIGWAPLTPHAYYDGAVVRFDAGWSTPVHYWNFVPGRSFTAVEVGTYVQPPERARRIFGSTRGNMDIRVENGRVMNVGIDVGFVEHRTNSHLAVVHIDDSHSRGERVVRDGGADRIEVYRPKMDVAAQRPAFERGGAEGRQMASPARVDPAPVNASPRRVMAVPARRANIANRPVRPPGSNAAAPQARGRAQSPAQASRGRNMAPAAKRRPAPRPAAKPTHKPEEGSGHRDFK
jgi:hypothetical protein